MVDEDRRRGNRVRRGEETIARNWDRRMGKEGFLEANNRRLKRGKEMAKIVTMRAETSDVPMKKRHKRKVNGR